MINQITRMRLPDGSEVAFVDWGDIPLFSVAWVLSGFTDSEINFFTYLVGEPVSATSNAAGVPTATELDTNIATAGAMAGTEEMLVYSIKPSYEAYVAGTQSQDNITTLGSNLAGMPIPNGPSLALLQAALLLRLEVSQKNYVEAPLGYFNSGFGVFNTLVGTPAAAALASYANAGLPSQEAVRSFAMPTYIGGTEKYRVYLANFADGQVVVGLDEAAGGGSPITGYLWKIRMILEGLYKRPVS